jgi:catechol-2,3-dioxygenase
MDAAAAPAAGPLTGLFTMIDHVGIAVADLDAAIAFYRDTYGMPACTRRSTRSRASARR